MKGTIYLLLCHHAHEFKRKKEKISEMISVPYCQEEESAHMAQVFVVHPFQAFEDVARNIGFIFILHQSINI
jgi:hypothetical protein